jgi:hypothetical protein
VSRLADRPKFNHHPAIIGHVRADTALRLFAGFRLFAKELIDLAQKQLDTIPRGAGTLPADESKTAAPRSTGATRSNRSVQPEDPAHGLDRIFSPVSFDEFVGTSSVQIA